MRRQAQVTPPTQAHAQSGAFFTSRVHRRHQPRADGFAAFADGEADALFQADRFAEFEGDLGLVARHHERVAVDLDHAADVGCASGDLCA